MSILCFIVVGSSTFIVVSDIQQSDQISSSEIPTADSDREEMEVYLKILNAENLEFVDNATIKINTTEKTTITILSNRLTVKEGSNTITVSKERYYTRTQTIDVQSHRSVKIIGLEPKE